MLLQLDRRDARLPVISGLIALAWLTLTVWGQTPYGRYLDHGEWLQSGFAAIVCRALPAGFTLLPILFYVAGWTLMIVAMMLPTTVPLLAVFARVTTRRADRWLLLTLVVVGYLLTWTIFGLVAHVADLSGHRQRRVDAGNRRTDGN